VNLNIDSASFRSQVKLLTELTAHLEAAAEICDLLNGAKEPVQNGLHPPLVVSMSRTTSNSGKKFVAGSRKANTDMAEAILKEMGHAMHLNDIFKLMTARGSTIGKPNTVAVYLGKDERFARNHRKGCWQLSKIGAIL
jgi:hypothetical protein